MTVNNMVANQGAWEQFQSYFRGWRDGASGCVRNPACSEHGNKTLIRIPYNAGYDDGHKASNEAAAVAAKKYGYEISKGILR